MENHSLVLTSGGEAEAKSTQIAFCAKSLGAGLSQKSKITLGNSQYRPR